MFVEIFGKTLGQRLAVDHYKSDALAYLRSSQTHSIGAVHSFIHVFDKLLKGRIGGLDIDWGGHGAEHRMTVEVYRKSHIWSDC